MWQKMSKRPMGKWIIFLIMDKKNTSSSVLNHYMSLLAKREREGKKKETYVRHNMHFLTARGYFVFCFQARIFVT